MYDCFEEDARESVQTSQEVTPISPDTPILSLMNGIQNLRIITPPSIIYVPINLEGNQVEEPPRPIENNTKISRKEINDRRKSRRYEGKTFDNFYNSLPNQRYLSDEIVDAYNQYFITNISLVGFGRLSKVKTHFSKERRITKIQVAPNLFEKRKRTFYIKKI